MTDYDDLMKRLRTQADGMMFNDCLEPRTMREAAGAIATLNAQLAAARADALEEAAKVAENNGWAGYRHRRARETADDIATAIRALATQGQTDPVAPNAEA